MLDLPTCEQVVAADSEEEQMAEKVSGRWEESFGADLSRLGREGLRLTVTRKGVEVSGAYDSGYGGFTPLAISWADLLSARDRVDAGNPREVSP